MRLHRSNINRRLAGVCGGVAECLGIDPSIVRVLWLLLVLTRGAGVLLYIVLAVALPLEEY